jgi:3-oxoadipate enol-lactonase/4-carboxymuconolactone decarboxylase
VRPQHTITGPAGAPVLVLAGSLGTTSAMWDLQLPSLTQRFRVVRVEHRGHAGAAVPPGRWTIADLGLDLVELLDHLAVERASLCGLSLGGMAAMWVAAHHPDRVDRLVLACTAAQLPPASSWIDRAATVRQSGTAVLVDTLISRWFTPENAAAGAPVAAMLAGVDPEGYARCCEAIAVMDLRADLARITAPTLVIAGSDDPVTPPSAMVDLQQAIARSALVVLPRAAHLANIEQPDRFTDAVLDHVTGRPIDRGRAIRQEVLGAAHVERSGRSPFTAPFVDLITRYAWGEIWTRPGLDRRTRSAITLSMLVALGRFEELALHVRGARANGLSVDEIGEVLLHTAVYCGAPAANRAFEVAAAVLAEEDGEGVPP